MNKHAALRPELDQPLQRLQLSTRSRRAAEQLGLATVRDFLLFDKDRFLAAPGCGERTWRELESRVCSYLALRLSDTDARRDDDRPIAPLLHDENHALQLRDNGITTVGDFLARPRAAAQRIPCLRKNGWMDLLEAITRTRRQPPSAASLLPDALRTAQLRSAGIVDPLLQELLDLGCETIGHAMLLPACTFEAGGLLGPDAAATIRAAIGHLLAPALEPHDEATETDADWPSLRARLLAALDDDSRDWFCSRIGIPDGDRSAAPQSKPASAELAQRRDEAVRQRLLRRAPTLVQRLRREHLRELDAFEGAVPMDRLAAGTWLHAIGKGSGDAALPLRLLAFCFPAEAFFDGNCVSASPPRVWTRLRQRIRELTATRLLPVRLEDLSHGLSDVLESVPRGVLTRLIAEQPRLQIRIDDKRGEFVQRAQPAIEQRLERILAERGRPTRFLDLVFDYRERYQSANEGKLSSHLRRSNQFVQPADGMWSLAAWHVDELDQLRPEADRIVQAICAADGKQKVASLHAGDERARWLLDGLVRRDARIRWLGRGEACPATLTKSRVLDQLLRDFRKAAGEVPMSRFVENQPPERRRLVERLLQHNRLFVFPSPDRIDVLTNYPFNEERLQRLLRLVDDFLVARSGYAPLGVVVDEVNRCDLGGSWLHPTLLGELLRRHGPFETLPGGYVARKSLGLVGWLMRRARAALREAGVPIRVGEMLAQRPELAEFSDCLEELLAHDPLVAARDGGTFQIA